MEEACFGAGCFWGVQAAFDNIEGMKQTTVGYMGGTTEHPSYEQVCTNKTGHAEVVHILFDARIVSYEKLLETFFGIHDPTQINRQGPDVGSQYRSIIFYYTEQQRILAEKLILSLKESQKFTDDIVTEIIPAAVFYKAEEYHQHYFKKNRNRGCGHLS